MQKQPNQNMHTNIIKLKDILFYKSFFKGLIFSTETTKVVVSRLYGQCPCPPLRRLMLVLMRLSGLPVQSRTKHNIAISAGAGMVVIAPLGTPSLLSNVGPSPNPNAPRSISTPRAPGPSGAPGHGQVIPSEREPSRDDTDQTSGNDIKAVMVELEEARRDNVYCRADWDHGQEDQVDWGRSGLVADGHDG